MTSALRELGRPRLVALHLLVVAIVAVLGSLGAWQLERHAEASERAAAIEARLARPAVPVAASLDGLRRGDTAALADREFLPVTATGRWEPDAEVLQRGRSHAGRAGLGVLTPLVLEDGSWLLVRRGTVPFDNDLAPPVSAVAPPEGTVTVTGTLERSVSQPTGPLAQRDPDDGELDLVFNADLSRLASQLGEPLQPMLLRVDESSMSAAVAGNAGPLLPPSQPEPDPGPHLSYAVQWFSFALIAAGMYGVWLRRRVAHDERAIAR